jgi:hypothetical protein
MISICLGGLEVSVLATGPNVREFDPDRWIFLRLIKIRSTTSSLSHVVDLRHVKEPYGHRDVS